MKAFLTIMSLMLFCFELPATEGKRSVSLDISSAIVHFRPRISIGYAFCRHWSAEADISLDIRRIAASGKEELDAHWYELYGKTGDSDREFRGDLTENSIIFSFWPKVTFNGPFLSLGYNIRDREGPDIAAEAGYSCRIWKGLRTDISYRTRVIETLRKRRMPEDGIRIRISYEF